jgi:hypothetical protein
MGDERSASDEHDVASAVAAADLRIQVRDTLRSPIGKRRSRAVFAGIGAALSIGIVAFRLPSESGTVPVALLGGVLALSALAAA